jgi:hypothetical protein
MEGMKERNEREEDEPEKMGWDRKVMRKQRKELRTWNEEGRKSMG